MKIEWHRPPFVLKEVKLEVTHRCPLTCIHCSSEATPSSTREMPLQQALKLADELVDLGVEQIDFSGGEPLIWPGIKDLVRKFRSADAELSIYTSGYVDDFNAIISELSESGIDKVIFSIFGGTATAHERITRRAGSFLKTLEAVRFTISQGITTELHFVPLSFNYMELPKMVGLAVDLKVSRISILRFVPQGRGLSLQRNVLNKMQNIRLKRMIEEGRTKIKIRAGSPFNFLLVNESPECCAAIDRISIGPEFDIFPCDAFKQIKAKDIIGADEYSRIGQRSLKECWNKSRYLGAVRNYLTTDFPEKCKDCSILEKCLSGCLAQKVLTNRDFRKDIDPMCIRA